jgi:hypothetical protein
MFSRAEEEEALLKNISVHLVVAEQEKRCIIVVMQ